MCALFALTLPWFPEQDCVMKTVLVCRARLSDCSIRSRTRGPCRMRAGVSPFDITLRSGQASMRIMGSSATVCRQKNEPF